MKDVMIDIETLSTDPARAVVLSVAAKFFELRESGPVFGDSLYHVLSIREQIAAGRRVDMDTVTWWQQQPTAAREAWSLATGLPVREALVSLASFLKPATGEIWSNGIVFDLGNLESLFRENGFAVPWRYSQARDLRTIIRKTEVVRDAVGPFDGVAHHPVSDSEWGVHELYRRAPLDDFQRGD